MSDMKKRDANGSGNDLKYIDAEKTDNYSNSFSQSGMSEIFEGTIKKKISLKDRRKKRLPVFIDIIIGVLIIAITIGVVIGAFTLFRYYSDDYGDVKIEYKIIAYSGNDYSLYRTMKNKELYMDSDDNTYYFGKIANVELIENPNGENVLILTVKASVKYRKGTGYSIGENRIAIGSEYSFRSETVKINGTVVELAQTSVSGGK